MNPLPTPNANATPGIPNSSDGDHVALVLDAASVAALHQLDPSGANRLVQRVLTTYRSSLDRLLSQLALARVRDDVASVRLVTHTLKSSSASVGALALSALCAEAEQAVRDGRLEMLPLLLDQLEAESARVDVAVLQLLSDPATLAR
jgi:HPt (histidine-containing phosphotransfer) domain-containing protein